jgi:hypothetical protein
MQLKALLFVIGYKHSAPNGAKNSKFIGYAIFRPLSNDFIDNLEYSLTDICSIIYLPRSG